uniref:folate gamma-glutamyl hydrolase n=1 Tax=Oryzias sinensis TaxID=183150 RepID=A0A8C7Y3N0_9TELE
NQVLYLVFVFAVLLAAVLACAPGRSQQLTDRPIIGVLAQEILPKDAFARGSSYIAASYVKFLESAGARVAPIQINLTDEEYTKLFHSINGLLLPGGDVDIQKSQFSRVSKIFYSMAVRANDAGDYFPIWGTCQGFQQLTVLTANKNLLTLTDTKASVSLCHSNSQQQPSPAKSSRLFRSFPKDLLQLANENIPSRFHSWSLSAQNYSKDATLKRFYRVLAINSDGRKEFISTMEANRYPFSAVQWHPEKSTSETSFYTASFFVAAEEEKALIYNFCLSSEAPTKNKHLTFFNHYYECML